MTLPIRGQRGWREGSVMTETLPSVSSMPKEVKKRVFRSEAEALLPDETAHLARRVGSPAGLTGSSPLSVGWARALKRLGSGG